MTVFKMSVVESKIVLPEEKIPRPPNAFMIFGREYRKLLHQQYPNQSNQVISVHLGKMWREMSKENKEVYYEKAKLAEIEHKKKYPGYVYNPKEARARKELYRSMRKNGVIPNTSNKKRSLESLLQDSELEKEKSILKFEEKRRKANIQKQVYCGMGFNPTSSTYIPLFPYHDFNRMAYGPPLSDQFYSLTNTMNLENYFYAYDTIAPQSGFDTSSLPMPYGPVSAESSLENYSMLMPCTSISPENSLKTPPIYLPMETQESSHYMDTYFQNYPEEYLAEKTRKIDAELANSSEGITEKSVEEQLIEVEVPDALSFIDVENVIQEPSSENDISELNIDSDFSN